MFLYRVIRALESRKVPYALVGGYAVALHGAVRGTVDIDLVIRLVRGDFERAEAAFRTLGLEARLPVTARQVFDFREEYVRDRNLIAWSFYNPLKPLEAVDVLITEDLRALKVTTIPAGPVRLKVASIDDLIRMKSAVGRPQDKALESARGASAEDIVRFLEEFRELQSAVAGGGRSRLISIKVPERLLSAFRLKADREGTRYQTQIKRLMMEWLKE